MRKTLATGLTAAILVAGTPFSVPTVSAQVRGRTLARVFLFSRAAEAALA